MNSVDVDTKLTLLEFTYLTFIGVYLKPRPYCLLRASSQSLKSVLNASLWHWIIALYGTAVE